MSKKISLTELVFVILLKIRLWLISDVFLNQGTVGQDFKLNSSQGKL